MYSNTKASGLEELDSANVSITRCFSDDVYAKWLLWITNTSDRKRNFEGLKELIAANKKPAIQDLQIKTLRSVNDDLIKLLTVFQKQGYIENAADEYRFRNRLIENEATLEAETKNFYTKILGKHLKDFVLKQEDENFATHYPSIEFADLAPAVAAQVTEKSLRELFMMQDSEVAQLNKYLKVNFRGIEKTLPSILIKTEDFENIYEIAYRKVMYHLVRYMHTKKAYLDDIKFDLRSLHDQTLLRPIRDEVNVDEKDDSRKRLENGFTILNYFLQSFKNAMYVLKTIFNKNLLQDHADNIDFLQSAYILVNHKLKYSKPPFSALEVARLLETAGEKTFYTKEELTKLVMDKTKYPVLKVEELTREMEDKYGQANNPGTTSVFKINREKGSFSYIHINKLSTMLLKQLNDAYDQVPRALRKNWLNAIKGIAHYEEMNDNEKFELKLKAIIKKNYSLLYIFRYTPGYADNPTLKKHLQNSKLQGELLRMMQLYLDKADFAQIFSLDRANLYKEVSASAKAEMNFLQRFAYWFVYTIIVRRKPADGNSQAKPKEVASVNAPVKKSEMGTDTENEQRNREKIARELRLIFNKWKNAEGNRIVSTNELTKIFFNEKHEQHAVKLAQDAIYKYREEHKDTELNEEAILVIALKDINAATWGTQNIADVKVREIQRYIKNFIHFYIENMLGK